MEREIHIYILRGTSITAQNIFFNLRKVDNRKRRKNYVIVDWVKLCFELYALAIREQPIFIQLQSSNNGGILHASIN